MTTRHSRRDLRREGVDYRGCSLGNGVDRGDVAGRCVIVDRVERRTCDSSDGDVRVDLGAGFRRHIRVLVYGTRRLVGPRNQRAIRGIETQRDSADVELRRGERVVPLLVPDLPEQAERVHPAIPGLEHPVTAQVRRARLVDRRGDVRPRHLRDLVEKPFARAS